MVGNFKSSRIFQILFFTVVVGIGLLYVNLNDYLKPTRLELEKFRSIKLDSCIITSVKEKKSIQDEAIIQFFILAANMSICQFFWIIIRLIATTYLKRVWYY